MTLMMVTCAINAGGSVTTRSHLCQDKLCREPISYSKRAQGGFRRKNGVDLFSFSQTLWVRKWLCAKSSLFLLFLLFVIIYEPVICRRALLNSIDFVFFLSFSYFLSSLQLNSPGCHVVDCGRLFWGRAWNRRLDRAKAIYRSSSRPVVTDGEEATDALPAAVAAAERRARGIHWYYQLRIRQSLRSSTKSIRRRSICSIRRALTKLYKQGTKMNIRFLFKYTDIYRHVPTRSAAW